MNKFVLCTGVGWYMHHSRICGPVATKLARWIPIKNTTMYYSSTDS